MDNIVETNNTNLRLCELRVGLFSTLRVSLPQVSESATEVQLLITNGTICTAYSASKNADGIWICDVDSAQFSSVGKQKYEVAYKLSSKQFYDGAGWVVVVPATTSGIVPQPVPPPHRYAIISITQGESVYYADANGNITLPQGGGSGDVKHSDFTNVDALTNFYRMSDMKDKINEILSILKGTACLVFALFAFASFGGVGVQKTQIGNLWNYDEVVTNVTYTADIDTNAVKDIASSLSVTNAGAVAVANAELAGYLKKENEDENTSIKWSEDKTELEITSANIVSDSNGTSIGTGNFDVQTGNVTAYEGDVIAYANSGNHHLSKKQDKLPYATNAIPANVISGAEWITQGTADGRYVKKSGDTMSGSLKIENSYGNVKIDGTTIRFNDVEGDPTGGTISAPASGVGGNITMPNKDGVIAVCSDIPDISSVSQRMDYIEGYLGGNRVRLSVTNYYGNTSGELPRLRIEEFVTETNYVGDVAQVTNYWRSVWDEAHKYETFATNITSSVASMTNGLERWSYNFMMTNMAKKADRAWGKYTSAGEAAPPDVVWHSATKTVFAGGTEFAHAVCGTGVIAVLSSVGAPIYTEGARGRFYFQTEDGGSYFGLNIQERYELPCDTDGIVVTQVGGNNLVSLTYNVTTATKPILYYKENLSSSTGWEQLTDSSGQPVAGASIVASWDDNPPAGSEICEMNCGTGASGFFTAALEFAGSSKFETNMSADLRGGILATNQTTNQTQPIEPYIVNGQVLWRLKQ